MPKPKGTHHVISAGETLTGAPVYLTAHGRYSRHIQEAAALASNAERDELLQAALRQEDEICDPYSFMVEVRGGKIEPLSARETIRAQGPTTVIRRPDRGRN